MKQSRWKKCELHRLLVGPTLLLPLQRQESPGRDGSGWKSSAVAFITAQTRREGGGLETAQEAAETKSTSSFKGIVVCSSNKAVTDPTAAALRRLEDARAAMWMESKQK